MSLRKKITLYLSGAVLVAFLLITIAQSILTYTEFKKDERRIVLIESLRIQREVESSFGRPFDRLMGIKDVVQTSKQNRAEILELLKKLTRENDLVFGTWTIFEPNAFDGLDSRYKNTFGHDSTGRLIYYVNKSKSPTELTVDVNVNFEKDTNETTYYFTPKKTKRDVVMSPYLYYAGGHRIWIVSLIAPVIRKGVFAGVIGIDFTLKDFSEKIKSFKPLQGKGYARIIFPDFSSLPPASGDEPPIPSSDFIKNEIKSASTFDEERYYRAILPMRFSNTGTELFIEVGIPHSIFYEELAGLILKNAILTFLFSLFALGFLNFALKKWFLNGLSKAEAFSREIEKGNLNAAIPYTEDDELGTLVHSLDSMRRSLKNVLAELQLSNTIIGKNNQKLRMALLGAGMATWELDFKSGIVFFPEGEISGLSVDETRKMRIKDFLKRFHRGQRMEMLRYVQKFVYGNSNEIEILFPNVLPEGVRWFRARGGWGISEPPNDEKLSGTLSGIVFDVTDWRQAEDLRKANGEILMRTRIIEIQKKELEDALQELKNAQNKLISSEKWASLGQLVTSIAHEINNPLGAIKAGLQTIEAVSQSFQNKIFQVSVTIPRLNEEDRNSFFEIYAIAMDSQEPPLGFKMRQQAKSLEKTLNFYHILHAERISVLLTELGLQDVHERWTSFLNHPDVFELLGFIDSTLSFLRNISVMRLSVEKTRKTVFALSSYSSLSSSRSPTPILIEKSVQKVLDSNLKLSLRDTVLRLNLANLPPIDCDPEEINQVWTHMILNAVQATEGNGNVDIYGSVIPDRNRIQIFFQDNGPGIPKEIQSKIFDPFFSTKEQGEGIGLGLDICKRIVEKYDGILELVSSAVGACFRIEFPISDSYFESPRSEEKNPSVREEV
ncbi:HAMP domain-containing protein [Leptospira barantonii]|uniref:histidine kinase n=1 Tax=Leptospira barantonii TaxID=2023184 RepID=A0A5F2B074_9LEPT|nr:ATP-binding protein [Leptospira barantonii]TGL97507.1 HAMP domain-containing protein [Leptospira barantonii]